MKKDFKLGAVLPYFLVLSLLLTASININYMGSVYLRGNLGHFLILLFLAIGIILNKKFAFDKYSASVLCLLVIYLLGYALFTRFHVLGFFFRYVLVFIFGYIYFYSMFKNKKIDYFLRAFSNVIIIIAAISIVFWVFGTCLDLLPGRTKMTYYWASRYRVCYTYYGLYFENIIQSTTFFGRNVVRNCAIFTEAPEYTSWLLYALIVESYIINRKKHKKLNIIILIVALLTTLSSKAVIILFLYFFFRFIISPRNKNIYTKILGPVIASLGLIGFGYNTGVRLLTYKTATGSYNVRIDDLLSAFRAFMAKPLFGWGYRNSDAILSFSSVIRSNEGVSMGITILLAEGGLYMTLFYAAAIILLYRCYALKQYRREVLECIILYVVNAFISDFAFSCYTVLLLSMVYSFVCVDKKCNYKEVSTTL